MCNNILSDYKVGNVNLIDAQRIMLDILNVYSQICDKNNLNYWLGSGTLLGAVRHKGFIPWDDDLDVMMPRQDYERFLKIAKDFLPENIFLQTKITDKHYNRDFAKLRDKNSKIIEPSEKRRANYHQGLFIDIFPMDSVDKKKKIFFSFVKHFFIKERINELRLKLFPRFLFIIGCLIFIFFDKERLKNKINEFVKSNNEDSFLAFGLEVPFERIIPYKDIYPLKPIYFCGSIYKGPANPDNYLKITYGMHYMTLPPYDKRETHAISIEIS